ARDCNYKTAVGEADSFPFWICCSRRSVGDEPSTEHVSIALPTGKRLQDRVSHLQAPEQFVERQLYADVKIAEVCVLGADRIETHFVNDRFDLKCVAREQRHAPFRVVEASRTGDELFHSTRELASDRGMSLHQFTTLIKRQRVPIPLFATAFAHVVKTDHR